MRLIRVNGFEGLYTYVVATKETWQLQGGITNSDWVLIAGSGGSINRGNAIGNYQWNKTLRLQLHTFQNGLCSMARLISKNDGYTLSTLTITMLVIPQTGSTLRSIY